MGDAMNKTEGTDNLSVGHTQKLHRWRIAFFGTVILLAGIVIGGALMLILMPHKLMRPPRGPEFESLRMIPPLRRDLGLSGEQSEQIKPILDKHMLKLQDIREDARSEISETLEQMNQEISAILSEGQRRIWQGQLGRLQQDLHPGGWRRGAGGGRMRRGGEGPGPWPGRGQQQPFRRGPGPFGPSGPPDGPNFPRNGMDQGTVQDDEKGGNTEP
jgi:hypothetical protein